MHMIAYSSDFTGQEKDISAMLNDIVGVAQKQNPKFDITGVLFFLNNTFMQVIEGQEAHLRQLMGNIEKDARHAKIVYLIDDAVDMRGFSDWNMDVFELQRGKSFDSGTLKKLTESFEKNLKPKSDILVQYYKALLAEQKSGQKYLRKNKRHTD